MSLQYTDAENADVHREFSFRKSILIDTILQLSDTRQNAY